MFLKELLQQEKTNVSFEVFPPKKTDALPGVMVAVEELAAMHPDFISVTYGAGGGTSDYTVSIAKEIETRYQTTALAHLTCVASTKAEMTGILQHLRDSGIQNILAMRGDIPEDNTTFPNPLHYRYASDLIHEIVKFGGFGIAGACYPEGHVESESREADLEHLKYKVDCGCDALITQLFFDNRHFYEFRELCANKGIDVPILAGIMPIGSVAQIARMCSLSGATLPQELTQKLSQLDGDADAVARFGAEYAATQIRDLVKNGVAGIHLYTMNKPQLARTVLQESDLLQN